MNGRGKWKILMLMAIAMSGCGSGEGAAPAASGDDSLRVRTDAARGRTWVLGLDGVRVYDSAGKRLIRRIALPGWSVARYLCAPDLALDRSGSAIISSNAQPRLWKIDAKSLEVKEQAISLGDRERWDVGFGALTFTANGSLLALTSNSGSLWNIDVGKGTARMVEPETTYLDTCELPVLPKSKF